jgi:homoserine O-acetyltransferase
MPFRVLTVVVALAALAASPAAAQPASAPQPSPTGGDFVIHDFHFQSGESLPELRLHYTTFGSPKRDAARDYPA